MIPNSATRASCGAILSFAGGFNRSLRASDVRDDSPPRPQEHCELLRSTDTASDFNRFRRASRAFGPAVGDAIFSRIEFLLPPRTIRMRFCRKMAVVMFTAPLGSGSAGNSYIFESGRTSILIDAGFGTRETERRLGELGRSLGAIDALVITHEHYDHIRGAERISRKFGIPIFLTRGTLDGSTIDKNETRVCVFENNRSFRIGDLEIHPRRVIHDAADPACFVVESLDGTRAGLATDLGYADDAVIRHLQKCDILYFESNHDVDMLRTGSYPWSLKRRILSRHGHLSNDDSMRALERLVGADLKALCLIHLSEKNNHESIVRTMASELLSITGARLELRIASQAAPVAPFEVARRSVIPYFKPAQLPLFA